MSDSDDGDNAIEEPDDGENAVEEPEADPESLPWSSADVPWMTVVVIGVALVVVAGTLTIYVVNPTWFTYCLVVGMPLLSSLLILRFKPNLASESVLLAINTLVVWVVYFAHPNPVAFIVGVVMLILVMRVILIYFRGTEREAILESFRNLEEPVKIDNRLAMYLNGDERYVLVTHLHVVQAIWWYIAMVVWIPVVVIIYTHSSLGFVGLLVMLASGELVLVIKPLLLRHEYICLTTNKRLFMLYGIVKKGTSETSLAKITDQSVTITRPSTILSWLRLVKAPYGYTRAETAGQSQDKQKIENKIGPLPNIYAFQRAVTQMITAVPDDD
jgi:hypothetical protein